MPKLTDRSHAKQVSTQQIGLKKAGFFLMVTLLPALILGAIGLLFLPGFTSPWSRLMSFAVDLLPPPAAKPIDRQVAKRVAELRPSAAIDPAYRLTWHDEFNGDRLDQRKWHDLWPWNGRTNNTHFLNYYLPAEQSMTFTEGKLRIKVEARSAQGYRYTTGMISSHNKASFQYGYFEMRAKLPQGRGLWPAFWLLPQVGWPPEIDVVEMLGHQPNKLYLSNHWRDRQGKATGYSHPHVGPNFAENYHIYAVEWQPNWIAWYIDGQEVYRTTDNIPQVPMYVLAQNSVGGEWPGPPDGTTQFPAYLDIDYIRVFQITP